MDEAEQLCDRLVIMDRGKIAEEGSPLELIRRLSTREVVELRFPGEVPVVEPQAFDGRVARIDALPDRLLLYTDDGDALAPVAHEQLHPQSVLVRRSTLEDVFLRLTGRTLID
jgi:lipooligosaccharide transport system ATP-binding protein